MKCVYIVQVMFKNYIKNIVNKINHSLHCYFVVCWIPTFVGKHGSHKNGTGVFPTSILRSKKNKCCWCFTLKIKLSHDRRSFQFWLDNAVWGKIPLFGIYLVKRKLEANIFWWNSTWFKQTEIAELKFTFLLAHANIFSLQLTQQHLF